MTPKCAKDIMRHMIGGAEQADSGPVAGTSAAHLNDAKRWIVGLWSSSSSSQSSSSSFVLQSLIAHAGPSSSFSAAFAEATSFESESEEALDSQTIPTVSIVGS